MLEGTLERVTYHNAENGYSVVHIRPSMKIPGVNHDEDGLVTVVGNMPDVQPGETVRITGQWATHPSFGRQFKATNVQQMLPTTTEGIKRYLSSGLVKGVGAKTAEKIVRFFGAETMNVLDMYPDRMYDVPGIKKEVIERIITTWDGQRAIKDVMVFLQGHNITTGLAVKIFKKYGSESVAIVQEDPYQLAKDIQGIGFRTADKVAREMGLPADSPNRVNAGVVYALEQNILDGHTYSPRAEIIGLTSELLGVSEALVDSAILRLQTSGEVVIEDVKRAAKEAETTVEAVYLPAYYYTEKGVAKRLHAMASDAASTLSILKKTKWKTFFADLQVAHGITLTAQQQDAIKAIPTHKVSILTGGPGTGKTTTLRAAIQLLDSEKKTYALASPTGRAAKRLAEATGQLAQTIHRLLMYSPQEGWGYNEDSPLQVDAVIVDECSMLDLMLFYTLLRAIKPETHLLLVGDVDQLPSVGAGDVLRDVIASGTAHVTRLQTIFRQSEESLIVANAHKINRGEMPDLDNKGADFFIFTTDDAERTADLIVELVTTRIPAKFGLNPDTEIQVLAPMYKGTVGVETLNRRLQASLNPPGRAAEKQIGGTLFRVGDRVMQMRNNYDKGVFNGDIGRIHSIDPEEQAITVIIDNEFIIYDFGECDELVHAFCISTHKSQGSEYPAVVMPVTTQHYVMLQRNLIYTAITRARRLVVLVGSKQALSIAVSNDKVAERYSGLRHRLQ